MIYLNRIIISLTICFCSIQVALAQNTFPNSGKVGIGTSSPSKLLDVNGKSIFRDRLILEGVLRYDYFKDTNLLDDRILSITPNGRVRPLRTAFCDSIMIANIVKVGDSSIWLGQEGGGENALWTTNGPLMINSNSGTFNEDVYISSQGDESRAFVGFNQVQQIPPPPDPMIPETPLWAKFNVMSQNENALCAHTKHTHGVAFCSGVDYPNAKLFQGSLYTTNPNGSGGITLEHKVFIDGFGDLRTLGNLFVGTLDKGLDPTKFPGSQTNFDYKIAIVDDQSNGNGFLYVSNSGLNSNNAFEAVVDNAGGILLKSTVDMGGGYFSENVKIYHNGYIQLGSTSSGININGGKFIASNAGDITGTRLFIKDKLNGALNFKVTDKGYVYAREIEVTTSTFPDYVFEKDYNLMPLDELKKYIDKNKHLPGVPSAETVIEENLKLKEMNLLLLEKVEELTLYLIELNEKIENK